MSKQNKSIKSIKSFNKLFKNPIVNIKKYAYCFRDGKILFGNMIPKGALKICDISSQKDIDIIKVNARLSYDNSRHLVPGIPEARKGSSEAIDALIRFSNIVINQIKSYF